MGTKYGVGTAISGEAGFCSSGMMGLPVENASRNPRVRDLMSWVRPPIFSGKIAWAKSASSTPRATNKSLRPHLPTELLARSMLYLRYGRLITLLPSRPDLPRRICPFQTEAWPTSWIDGAAGRW